MTMDIVLALGGGGVKGHAHIGVLRVLEREGFRVRAIAGTSAGGLWGCFFAAGYSPAIIEEEMSRLNPETLYHRTPGDGPAMLGLAGIHELLNEKLGEITFSELRIPFAVTAVDLERAEQIILSEGRVVDAILATIAVPGIFPPRQLGGKILVDGGVLDPVPVEVARALMPGFPVVAVVLSPELNAWYGPGSPRLLNALPFLSNYLGRLRIAQALNIFMRSVDIGGVALTEMRLRLERPDVVIRPVVPHIGLLDKVNPRDVAKLGEEAAEAALPQLRQAVSWRGRISRQISSLLQPNGYVEARKNGS
jgi:NTE family protein